MKHKRRPILTLGRFTLFAWLCLPFYNFWILSQCSGDCAIRVDLLLVIPTLVILTLVWGARLLKKRGKDA